MTISTGVVTFLFTDIAGSTRLWEEEPVRMKMALAKHDNIARRAVELHHGMVVKTTGDGVHAAFAEPLDAIHATLQLQKALADPIATDGIPLQVRCGLHLGMVEQRDNDFFGAPVNRAARIMSSAHGGQVLISQAVATAVDGHLPDGAELRDLGAVRLRDLADPEFVYQLVHPALRQEFPALRSLAATPNNLPQQVTSFVGREGVFADVKKLLGSARLLTLLGAGGLGKTRLSLQVAADVMDDYADGVWFVDLAPLSDPQLVPQAVASVLGVKEEAGHAVQEALARYMRDRKVLLVLDNCEHLVQACAELAKQLLQSGPHVKLIATSRERLHIAGEMTYPMPSLAVPAAQDRVTVEALTRFEGVRLFIDRAVAVQPAFRVTDQNASAVADVCRRLDGIPLAIELAAARVHALSVEKIAERLADRFRLLTGGDKTALPRQQTLRALIDWSYDLLTPPERALLRRLAVFAGGWTLESAEAVGVGGDIEESDVLDVLTNLVEKSLVVLAAESERYRLLETVRQYALERLADSRDEHEARARHFACFLALAEQSKAGLVGPDQAEWLRRLDLERENILSAHAWCSHAEGGAGGGVEAGAEAGLRLLHAIKVYWINRGLLNLAHRLIVEALGRAGMEERGMVRCRALFEAGQVCALMGRYGDAQVYLGESLAIARELGDMKRVAAVLQPLALASLGQRDFTAARAQLDEALALAREQGKPREIAAALTQFAALHRMQGELHTAASLYEQVHALASRLGDQESVAIALLNLAMVAVAQGFADRARRMLLDVLDIAGQIGSKALGQSAADVAAGLAAAQSGWESAARFFGIAEAQIELTGLHRDPADHSFLAPLMASAREALGEARFSSAEASGRALTYEDAMRETRNWLAPR